MKTIKNKIIKTKRGNITTPFFMPDATRGFVKLCNNQEIKEIGIKPMVVNTLHLYLQPGLSVIKQAGGIHKFMNWPYPLLSDSGGFQVFSLLHQNPKMGKITDNGARFYSPLDGSEHILTPEKSIQIQFDLGVDMMVCLDDCPPNDYNKKNLAQAVDRTIAWAKRCKLEYNKQVRKRKLKIKPLLFSVIQGGAELDLRKKCTQELVKIDFAGYGFGARPVDKHGKFLDKVLQYTADLIPQDKLRFALGIGLPTDIVACAKMGWDMFDCVVPTREGRHGRLFFRTKQKKNFYTTINIYNAKFKNDFGLINKDSKVKELRENTKAYLHHLFKLKEPLGQRLAALNNLEFYMNLIKDIRNNKL